MMINLIINGATVLTMKGGVGYYNDASIGINDGKIFFISEQNDDIIDKHKNNKFLPAEQKGYL